MLASRRFFFCELTSRRFKAKIKNNSSRWMINAGDRMAYQHFFLRSGELGDDGADAAAPEVEGETWATRGSGPEGNA